MDVRIRSLLVHVAIFGTILGGISHLSLWAPVAGMSVLAIAGVAGRRVAAVGHSSGPLTDLSILTASLLNASAIAAAAYGFGRLTAVLCGL